MRIAPGKKATFLRRRAREMTRRTGGVPPVAPSSPRLGIFAIGSRVKVRSARDD